MKRLTKEIITTYVIGATSGIIAGIITQWLTSMWELAFTVGIVVFAGSLRDSISTYFGLRRNPEYQKDTKDAE